MCCYWLSPPEQRAASLGTFSHYHGQVNVIILMIRFTASVLRVLYDDPFFYDMMVDVVHETGKNACLDL